MRTIFIALTVFLICSAHSYAQGGTCGPDLKWEINYTTLVIKGTGSMNNYESDKTPEWQPFLPYIKKIIIEDGVLDVGVCAFENCSGVDTIILGNTIKNIRASGFKGCKNLKSINFPASLEVISNGAFGGIGLDSLFLPGSIKKIGDGSDAGYGRFGPIEPGGAFASDNLVYVNIAGGEIGFGSFNGCKNLKTVCIEEGTFGYNTFYNCINLDSIKIGEGVTNIGQATFRGCESLVRVNLPAGIESIEPLAFYECKKLKSINIPAKTIGNGAFEGCSELSSIILQEGVETIEDRAFEDCSLLNTVYFPSTVSSINYSAFGNSGISSFNVDESNNHYTSDNGVLYNKNKTDIIIFPLKKNGRYSTPNTVTRIRESCLANCSLSSIEISESVVEIGKRAFSSCSTLVSVKIPLSIKIIEEGLFADCINLNNVNIPESITRIGNDAFRNCKSLSTVKIPESAENYGSSTFYGCTGLDTVEVNRQYPYWIVNTNIFGGINLAKVTLVVPKSSKPMYESSPVWQDFGTIIENTVANERPYSTKNLKVYPNPAVDIIIVEQDANSKPEPVYIYNINGKKAFEYTPENRKSTINISNMPVGIYIVKTGKYSTKIIKR
ncbi:MAG: leucine-rich repeat domain-containing protein [Tannerella sp.]|jgi:hypothetical protein|nr:leucine-rich repeat domain-containing protein [Tannerella sp.]